VAAAHPSGRWQNAGPGASGDRLDITVDQATSFPLRVRETFRGRLVREQRIERLRVDEPAPASRFTVKVPLKPAPQRLDEGFRRVPLSRVRAVTRLPAAGPRRAAGRLPPGRDERRAQLLVDR